VVIGSALNQFDCGRQALHGSYEYAHRQPGDEQNAALSQSRVDSLVTLAGQRPRISDLGLAYKVPIRPVASLPWFLQRNVGLSFRLTASNRCTADRRRLPTEAAPAMAVALETAAITTRRRRSSCSRNGSNSCVTRLCIRHVEGSQFMSGRGTVEGGGAPPIGRAYLRERNSQKSGLLHDRPRHGDPTGCDLPQLDTDVFRIGIVPIVLVQRSLVRPHEIYSTLIRRLFVFRTGDGDLQHPHAVVTASVCCQRRRCPRNPHRPHHQRPTKPVTRVRTATRNRHREEERVVAPSIGNSCHHSAHECVEDGSDTIEPPRQTGLRSAQRETRRPYLVTDVNWISSG